MRNSDELALGEIYDRYHQPVYRYVLNLIKIPEVTEDIVHEVFLKLWEKRETLRVRENFKGYLFTACRNMSIDMTKQIAVDRELKAELLRYYDHASLERHYSQEELYKYDSLVEEALNTLSPQRRKVFEMSRKQGKSHQEIARELNISPNTVKEHMSRALTGLRDFLQKRGEISFAIILLGKLF